MDDEYYDDEPLSEEDIYRMDYSVLDSVPHFRRKEAGAEFFPTGFKALDEALGGGFYSGELCVIGAISSLGKTTFVQQIGDQMAEQGHDVLFFSLEMSTTELICKSLSRSTFNLDESVGKALAKTSREIALETKERYQNYSNGEKEIRRKAQFNYNQIAEQIFIFEADGDISVGHVEHWTKKHIAITRKQPIVIIDYLQILAPLDESLNDKQSVIDSSVTTLRRMARELNIPVIAISSFNRENYTKPVSMLSFKESGAIEYSADLLIGLQSKGVGEKGFDDNLAKAKNPREIEVKILKQRNGRSGETIDLEYYAEYNTFVESGDLNSDDVEIGVPFTGKK